MIGELYDGEFEAMEHNGRLDALEHEKSNNEQTVYVVTADGHRTGYGAEIYLIGVYDKLSSASRQAGKYGGVVKEVTINKTYPLKKDRYWGNMENEHYLGGYYE